MPSEIDSITSALGDLLGSPGAGGNPVYPTDDADLTSVSGKVVRLDVAVLAVHLLCARVFVRDLTKIVHDDMVSFATSVGEWAAVKAITVGILKQIFGQLFNVVNVFSAVKNNRAMGLKITENYRKVEADVKNCVLFKTHRKRKRKIVASRHKYGKAGTPHSA